MNKKLVLLLSSLLVFISILFVMVGLVSEPETWIITSVEKNGEQLDTEELQAYYFGDIKYTFDRGGKLVVEMFGQEVEGSWKKDGKSISISYNGIESQLIVDGDNMRLEKDGKTYIFSKI